MEKGKFQSKEDKRKRRHARVRGRVFGTALKPRFSVFRSNKIIFLQLIDDGKGRTILALKSARLKGKTKTENARDLGKKIANLAKSKNIEKVVFDRGGYKYHGRVRAVAEGAREGGLNF